MMLMRLSAAILAAVLLGGCTIGTVSTPEHFGTQDQFDFLDAGLQPIPETNQRVATPIPE